MPRQIRFAALGIDHRHVFGMAAHLLDAGAHFSGWWTDGTPTTLDGFLKRFDTVPRQPSIEIILDDPSIDLVVISAVPDERASLAIRAMRAGKDVMVDKPGCTTSAQLEEIQRVVAQTGRIWSIDFSERFEVPAVTRATELVRDGAIGQVIQTVGLGPHRLNLPTRPEWFFERERYGGILCDLASHQIDQFLHFSGATDARVVHADARNHCHPQHPGLQDFGEVVLTSERAHGYIRVDWFTPDALPVWGDGRLTILGADGYIELRKYVDVGGTDGSDHLVLVSGNRCEKIQCDDAGLPYFGQLCADVVHRTEMAMSQAHAFTVTRLALQAQSMAQSVVQSTARESLPGQPR